MISLNDVLLAMSNIPVDDPIAEIWGRGLQGGYKIIEYTGTLPITINANGEALLDYRIYGSNDGCGERTENFFDESTVTKNYYIDAHGRPSAGNGAGYSDLISVAYNETYSVIFDTLKFTGGSWTLRVHAYDENGTWIQQLHSSVYSSVHHISIPITIDNQAIKYIRISGFILYMENTMFVRGTDDISYQPYGYRLPMVTSDGTADIDTPVYIGENQLDSVDGVSDYVDKSSGKIVRRIKEYTFTGDELWDAYGFGFYTNKKFTDAIATYDLITIRFSHFTARSNTTLSGMYNPSFGNDCGCFRANGGNVMVSSTSNFTTVEECKAYFKDQYDNGTPVKIWYVLETAVEEEPPVSFPEIPTIDGTTVIDYDGDPKPSQMYVKYKDKSGGA